MEDLIATIGRPLNDEVVQSAMSHHQLKPEGRSSYSNHQVGVSLFVMDGRVQCIFLHSDGHQGYIGFSGTLPWDVTFTHTRQMARSALGTPAASDEDEDEDEDSYDPTPSEPWDR